MRQRMENPPLPLFFGWGPSGRKGSISQLGKPEKRRVINHLSEVSPISYEIFLLFSG